jgi:hypothetical protein
MAITNEAKNYKIFTNCFPVLADDCVVAVVLSVGESGGAALYYTDFLLLFYKTGALFCAVRLGYVFFVGL